ncbi:MAG TPA: flagellar biosynthesis protein FlgL, partial [Leptospiraceae bacterium]|nr:flagellar biosynthesis protein FlgL [Leptospiraceae bacterium]
MRITGQMSNNSLIRNLQRHEQGLDEVQNQIGTGIKIQRPSDDPGIATNTIYFRS